MLHVSLTQEMEDRFRKFAFKLEIQVTFSTSLRSLITEKLNLKYMYAFWECCLPRRPSHNCLMQGMKRKYFIYHEQQAHYILLISTKTPRFNKIVYFLLTSARNLPPCACTQKLTNLCAQVLVNCVRELDLVNCAYNIVNCAKDFRFRK